MHPTLDQTATGANPLFKHCDTLEFDRLPVGARLSQLSLSVQSVSFLATAPEGQTCQLAEQRLAASLVLAQLGISVRCRDVPGQTDLQIVTKPVGMTDEQALNLAGRESAGMILGPWTFANVPLAND